MNLKELEAFEKGWVDADIDGNKYEFVHVSNDGKMVLADINNGSPFLTTESELLMDENAKVLFPNEKRYRSVIDEMSLKNEELFRNSDYAVALLQIKEDFDKISFASYDELVKNDVSIAYDMYDVAHVEPMSQDRLEEIDTVNSSSYYTNLGDYMYEKINNPETRPSAIDGYFGVSASVSDIMLVKERDKVTALYTDVRGFKELEGFVPEQKTVNKAKTVKEERE